MAIERAYPPDFYAPSAAEVRQAMLRLGEASRRRPAPVTRLLRGRRDRA